MKWFAFYLFILLCSCNNGEINLPITKTTYYTQYLIYNASSEKIFLICDDQLPNQNYHNRICYIDTNDKEIAFSTHFLSKQEYVNYSTCLYLDSVKGETYYTKKKLQTQLINPSRWKLQIIIGDHTISKVYSDTLYDSDFN